MPRARSTNLRRVLARNLRAIRTARGWTQEATADRAGLNTRHYQKLEEGSVNVTLQTLERLSGALNVQGYELIAPS